MCCFLRRRRKNKKPEKNYINIPVKVVGGVHDNKPLSIILISLSNWTSTSLSLPDMWHIERSRNVEYIAVYYKANVPRIIASNLKPVRSPLMMKIFHRFGVVFMFEKYCKQNCNYERINSK